MLRRCGLVYLVGALGFLVAPTGCDGDGPTEGVRGPCASAGGPLADCPRAELETAEDACWRLVECGAIPIQNPEMEPDCCFDWARCVDYVEELPDPQLQLTLACLEAAPCDQLKWQGSPNRPNEELPPCLAQGN